MVRPVDPHCGAFLVSTVALGVGSLMDRLGMQATPVQHPMRGNKNEESMIHQSSVTASLSKDYYVVLSRAHTYLMNTIVERPSLW